MTLAHEFDANLLRLWYSGETLFDLPEQQQPIAISPQPANCLVIVNNPALPLPPNESVLLDKILQSVKLSIAQIQLLHTSNTANSGLSLATLLSIYDPKIVLLFGTSRRALGINIALKLYKPIFIRPNTQILAAHTLAALDNPNSAGHKKQLWDALREIFKLG